MQRQRPQYCRSLPGTLKKPACSKCDELCSFSMESLLHPTNALSQPDILDELANHYHPSSRKISDNQINRQRITQEAARELADHYIFAHNKKEPILF